MGGSVRVPARHMLAAAAATTTLEGTLSSACNYLPYSNNIMAMLHTFDTIINIMLIVRLHTIL